LREGSHTCPTTQESCLRIATILFVLICTIAAGFVNADNPALVDGQITVFGSRIEVSPAVLETPAGVPVFLNTTGKGLSGKLAGDLRGPGISGALTFETTPGSQFQLPALQTKGVYYLEDIRWENNGQILGSATPNRVEIRVIDLLISKITSRPLSLDEIRSLGIVIDEKNFSAVSFEVGLQFNSQTIQFSFPLLIPKSPGFAPLIPVPPQSVQFASPQLKTGSPSGVAGLPGFVPVTFKPSAEFNIDSLPDIPGIIVFPNDIAFLNQFFSVLLMVQNAASPGSSLAVEDLTARMVFDPQDLSLAKTTPSVPLGSPVPVRVPGADGVMGTADDLDIIIAGAQAQSEFTVEGLQEGTHIVKMNLAGTLHGLLQGEIPISGTAVGAVLVRNPNFSITFSHPSVVRAFEEYDLFVTVTNTSNVDANLVRLTIPANELTNCTIVGDPYQDFEAILSGESGTAKFRVKPLVTGQVVTAVITSSGNVTGQFQFRIGVGEKGIPLSPNTLLLPEYAHQLGDDLLQKGLSILGLAYSAASAPPGGLPPGIPYVSKAIVTQRAIELAQAGQRFQLGEPRATTLSHLLLDWLGNSVPDPAVDNLLHTSNSGMAFLSEIFRQLNIGENNAISFHDDFAQSTFYRNRYLSVMVASSATKPLVSILDSNGDQDADVFVSEDGLAQWALAGVLADPASHKLTISGNGGSSDISIIVPIGSSLYKGEISNLSTQTGKSYEIVFDNTLTPADPELKLKDETGAITTVSLSQINGNPPQAIAAMQDAKADKTGHLVAVLFDQPVTEQTAGAESNYFVGANRTADATLQSGGRIVYLAFQNPISPLVDTDLVISGVQSQAGTGAATNTLRILTTVTTEAGKVTGRFVAADGTPIPLAQVTLTEIDFDDIVGQKTEHITAATTTNAQGEFSFDYVRKLSDPFRLSAQDPLTGDIGTSSAIISFTNQLVRLDIVLLGRGTIKGKVFKLVSGSVVPVTDAVVSALALNEQQTRMVATDAFGNYLIDRVAVGTVNLSAQNANLADPAKFFGATTAVIPLAGSVVTADIEVTTTQPGSVKGRVLQSNGTDPIVGAYVMLSINSKPAFADITDDSGWFQFDQVPPGAIALGATDTATGQSIGTANVTLLAGASVTVNIVASGNGRIEAIVTPASGMTLSDIVVYVAGTPYSQRLSNNNTVIFNSIPVGSWSVFANNTAEGVLVSATATVLYSGSTAIVSLRFPEKGTVSGQIKTVDGAAAPGSTVLLFVEPWFDYLVKVTTADSNGHYLFKDVDHAKYVVHAVAANQNDGGSGQIVTVSDAVRNAVSDVTFIGKGTVTVHVETSAGPVQTAVKLSTVTFDVDGRITREITYTKTSDPQTGNAVFDNVFRLGFVAEASTLLTLPAKVSGTLTGPSTTVNILLTPNPNISGIVHDADGNPVVAEVTYTGGSLSQTVTSYPDGTFTFDRIALGDALFVACAGLCAPGSTKGELRTVITETNNPIDIHLLGSGSVHGMVKDGSGNPVGGATLRLDVPGILKRTLQGLSAPDGTYRFDTVPEGQFTIEATNGVTGGRAGDRIIHRADIPLDIILEATGTVQGTVFQSDGVTRVVATEVTLQNSNLFAIAFATTDGNGNYLIPHVPVSRTSSETYKLEAFSKNFGRRAASQRFLVASDGDVVNQNLLLEGLGSVGGFVYDFTGVNPISGASLTLLSSGVQTQMLVASSGSAGDFQFAGVPQGAYSLTAAKNLLAGQVTGSVTQDGQSVRQNVLLAPSAEIRGTIHFFDGTPVPAGVNPIVSINGSGISFNVDAPDGAFFVSELPLGSYRLQTNFTYQNKPYRGIARVTLNQTGERFVTLSLKGLNTLNVAITGFVPTEANSVSLTYSNDMENRTESLAIPSNGIVQFINVPESTYTIMARSGELLAGSASGNFTGDGETRNVTVPLTSSGRVTGTVNYNGNPAAGVSITLTGASYVLYSYTDGAGQFSILGVPLGAYTISAENLQSGGKARATGSIDFENDIKSHLLNLDAIAPSVQSTTPSNGSTAVPNDSTIHVVFSEPMAPASTQAAFSLTYAGGAATGTAVITGNELVFTPASALAPQQTYNIVVAATAEDLAGNRPANAFVASFTTIDTVAPTLTNSVPVNLAYNVPLNTTLQLYFSETIANRGNYTVSRSSGFPASVSSETWNASHTVLTLSFASAFAQNERITFSISGFVDSAGNTQTSTSTVIFDTIDNQPPAAPALSANDPDGQIREGSTPIILAAVSEQLVNVDFFIKGVLRYRDTTAPYDYVVPASLTTIAANGSNLLVVEATATDRAGNVSTKTALTLVLLPDTAPQVTISSNPVPGDIFPGTSINVNYSVSDDGFLTKTLLIVTGAMNETTDLGAPTSGSRVIEVDPAAPVDTALMIKVRTTDDSGKSTNSSELVFTTKLDTTAPSVSFVQPANGSGTVTEGQSFTVSVNAADNVAIDRVEFTFNGNAIADNSTPYETQFTAPAVTQDTVYTGTVTAFDLAGNPKAVNFTMNVQSSFDPDQPTVQFVCPTGGLFPANYTLDLTVQVTDNNNVERVEFYRDSETTPFHTRSNIASTNTTITTTDVLSGLTTGQTRVFKAVVYDYSAKTAQTTTTIEIVSGTRITSAVTIPNTPVNPYENQTLIVENALTINGPHTFQDFIILKNGAVNHPDTTSASEFKLSLTTARAYIACGGKIDVIGRGYDQGFTYPNTTTGATIGNTSSSSNSGSYGGSGGIDPTLSGFIAKTYGSFVNPNESGSGGAASCCSYSGGGVVNLQSTTLVLDGNILATGAGDGGFRGNGAGGAVQIRTGAMGGSGLITANGGAGDRSGGGGRVAVYYTQDQMTGGMSTHIQARAGNDDLSTGGATGGAGTIYLHRTGVSTYGDLIVNNTGVGFPANSSATRLPEVGSGPISATNGSIVTCTRPGCAAMPSGLRNWWPAEGNAENIGDGGNGTHNTLGVSAAESVTYAPGKVGQAFSLNGISWVEAIDPVQLTTDYTMEAWVFPKKSGPMGIILRTDVRGPCCAFQNELRIATDGRFEHYANDGSSKIVKGTTVVVPNQWYHVAGVVSAGMIRLYVNGVQEGTAFAIGTIGGGTDRFWIGNSGSARFEGLIDEIGVFTRGLSSSEIQSIYSANTSGKCLVKFPFSITGLYLRVINADGTTFGDFKIASQNARNLTLEGLTANVTGKTYRGIVKLDSLSITGGAVLKTQDLLEMSGTSVLGGAGNLDAEVHSIGDMILEGAGVKDVRLSLVVDGDLTVRNGATLKMSAPLSVNGNLNLQSSSVLTHRDTSLDGEFKLDVTVAGDLTVDSSSKIDVSGLGYDAGTILNTTNAASDRYIGGSYGGLGGTTGGGNVTRTYGSFAVPFESGAGSGSSFGFSGGGVVKITSGSLQLDGSILANGAGQGLDDGGGAGGAIRIHTGAISGIGTIAANGGFARRSGGGGRIAIYYTQDQMGGGLTAHTSASGGAGDFNTPGYAGGAGTIFTFREGVSSSGDLLLDNLGVDFELNSNATLIPSAGRSTVTAVSGNVATCQRSGCITIPSGSRNWWPFEGDGWSFSGGRLAFLHGATSQPAGKVQGALNFNGTSSYVDAFDPLDPTTYTIEAWVNPRTVRYMSILFRTDGAGGRSQQLRIAADGRFEHYTFDGAGKSVKGTTVVAANQWYHVAGVVDGGLMRLYVNGVQEGTPVSVGTLWTGGDRYWIGASDGGGSFDGFIDEVTMYTRGLTASEILSIYSAGASGKCFGGFPNSVIGFTLRVLNADGSTYGHYRITAQSGRNLTLEGLTTDITGKNVYGVLKLNSLTVRNGAVLQVADPVEVQP